MADRTPNPIAQEIYREAYEVYLDVPDEIEARNSAIRSPGSCKRKSLQRPALRKTGGSVKVFFAYLDHHNHQLVWVHSIVEIG